MASRPAENLTVLEVGVLSEQFNLADGHAYRPWSSGELRVIEQVGEIFTAVDRRHQATYEREYLEAFFTLGEQTLDLASFACFMCFTASSALEVIANHLRLEGMSCALVEPCFDNLADILTRHGVRLTPLPDALLDGRPDALMSALSGIDTDAVFIVSPNNPTGARMPEVNFRALVEHCRQLDRMLILDACFRHFLGPKERYDQYQILVESGIDWIVVEDTGKTWPTLELKAPFFCVSRPLANEIGRIYADFLLHTSPFSLVLMTRLLQVTLSDGPALVHAAVSRNRAQLVQAAQGTYLAPDWRGNLGVSWLKITNAASAIEVRDRLREAGVHVLPGDPFFWNGAAQAPAHIRVALVRDPAEFARACLRLHDVCRVD